MQTARILLACASATAALVTATNAFAYVPSSVPGQYDFNFSYSFPTNDTMDFPTGQTSASGVLSATKQMHGGFLVVDVTGTWNGEAITGVAPLNIEAGNDNLIFPRYESVLDRNGVSFAVAGKGDVGGGFVNVFYDRDKGYTDYSYATGYSDTFNLSQGSGGSEPSGAPEPSSWALMITGVGVAGIALRRQSRTASVVHAGA